MRTTIYVDESIFETNVDIARNYEPIFEISENEHRLGKEILNRYELRLVYVRDVRVISNSFNIYSRNKYNNKYSIKAFLNTPDNPDTRGSDCNE